MPVIPYPDVDLGTETHIVVPVGDVNWASVQIIPITTLATTSVIEIKKSISGDPNDAVSFVPGIFPDMNDRTITDSIDVRDLSFLHIVVTTTDAGEKAAVWVHTSDRGGSDEGAFLDAVDGLTDTSTDAFGRFRVSDPFTILDSKQIIDNQPLWWDDQETSGTGTTSTHSTALAASTMGVAATTAGTRVRQTLMRFNYQAGKSQLILMTGVLDKSGGGPGIARSWGIYDDNNGLFLLDDEGTHKFVRRTSTSGSAVDNEVAQSDWNIDKMDGTGPSGITLDFSKTQILIIDFEWLGVGRVRFGFNVDGVNVYAHEMLNANVLNTVYMSTPNLPLRYEISNDGTGAASTMDHICATVSSEGGQDNFGVLRSVSTGTGVISANVDGTFYAAVGVRYKTAGIGAYLELISIDLMEITGSKTLQWVLCVDPTISGTFTFTDVPDSGLQVAIGGTATVTDTGLILTGGYFESGKQVGGSAADQVRTQRKLGIKIDGTSEVGVLAVRPLGSSNADVYASITWRETP